MHGLPDRTRNGKQTGNKPSYSPVALFVGNDPGDLDPGRYLQ